MEEFKQKQKSIRKKLFIASGILLALTIIFLIIVGIGAGQLNAFIVANNTIESSVSSGDSTNSYDPISGWAVLAEVFGKLSQVFVFGFGIVILLLFVFLFVMAIFLMWIIYGIYYLVQYNKLKKSSVEEGVIKQ